MIVHLYPLFLYFCDKLEEEYDAMDHNAFRVDIDRILRDKSPRYYNKIPKFLINWLKRTLHQDDINGILERNRSIYACPYR